MFTKSPVVPLLLLIAIFALSAVALMRVGVGAEEAQNLWIVRDVSTPDAPLSSALRTDLREWFDRVQTGPQPPLYTAALDVWTTILSHDIVAARLLSLLTGLVAVGVVAFTARIDKSSPAVAALIAAGLSVYAFTQAAMFAPVLLSAALSWLALTVWEKRPNLLMGLVYMVTVMGVLYSAHVAPVIFLLHGYTAYRDGMLRRWLVAFALAVGGFLPWLILFQAREIGEFTLLAVVISWLTVLVPTVAVYGAKHRPTGALLAAGSVAIVSLAWTGIINTGEPDAIGEIRALRDDSEPALTHFDPRQPMNYYNTQVDTRLDTGLAIDLSWREQTAETLAIPLSAVQTAPRVWLMMPADLTVTAQVADRLAEERSIGVDMTLDGVRYARFDRE